MLLFWNVSPSTMGKGRPGETSLIPSRWAVRTSPWLCPSCLPNRVGFVSSDPSLAPNFFSWPSRQSYSWWCFFLSSPGLPSWVYDWCILVDTQSLCSKWSHICSSIFQCCCLENCNCFFPNLGHGACGSWTLAHTWSHLYCLSGMDSQLPTCHSRGLYLVPSHPCVIQFRRWDQVACYEETCGLRLLSAPQRSRCRQREG